MRRLGSEGGKPAQVPKAGQTAWRKVGLHAAVVDRELLPYKLQVGQSGVMIKPRLYIGFGISGAVNHVTGIDAVTFVAVNTDPSAPIFNYCDYGIVADMDKVCDAMLAALEK